MNNRSSNDIKAKTMHLFGRCIILIGWSIWVYGLTGCQPPAPTPGTSGTVVGTGASGITAGPTIITPGIIVHPGFTPPSGLTSVVTPATETPETPPETEPFVEPTAEMIDQTWVKNGVPPARDPRINWYYQLSVKDLWKEIFTPENDRAAVVILKRPGLNRGYFDGQVLISEKEITDALQSILQIPGAAIVPKPASSMNTRPGS